MNPLKPQIDRHTRGYFFVIFYVPSNIKRLNFTVTTSFIVDFN